MRLVGCHGTRQNVAVGPGTRDRWFDWLLVLLVLSGAFFGLAPFLAPAQFASATGFAGTDVFLYRLAGAATFGYGVGLVIGYPLELGRAANSDCLDRGVQRRVEFSPASPRSSPAHSRSSS